MGASIFGSAEHGSSQFDASDVQDVDGDFETFLSFVEQIFDRYFHVIEEDLTSG